MLGVVIGPVFGIIPSDMIIQIVPYFAAVALIIIMFDGGLSLDIKKVVSTAHFALALSIFGFVVSVASVAAVAYFGLGWSGLESVLLGTIVGGSSSIIVFGLVKQLKISEETRSMLSLESAITDILVTVIAFVLIDVIVSGQLSGDVAIERFVRSLAVGTILGFGIGIPWMLAMAKLQKAQHAYMLTVGVLFVIFFWTSRLAEQVLWRR
jgi:cell volume regulation protein A